MKININIGEIFTDVIELYPGVNRNTIPGYFVVISETTLDGKVSLMTGSGIANPGSAHQIEIWPEDIENDSSIKQFYLSVPDVVTIPVELLVNKAGSLKSHKIEEILKKNLFRQVENYYKTVHFPQQNKEFLPGKSRINYAGRIFDEKELINLVDSSLDFWLTSGPYTAAFEEKFSEKLGVKKTLLVNSGSSANLLAFQALTSAKLKDKRINKSDEVITVAAGFPTTVTPILQYGAVPVFVDIRVEDGTYNINSDFLEEALSERTKAIMIAHTLGNPFDISAVVEFCKKHNLWLIEDNCDALGSTYAGKYTGSFGNLSTSSFYPPHHITMGEGGAVYGNDIQIMKLVESFRDWGRDCWCPSGKDDTCKKRFKWDLGELPYGYDHKYIYSHMGYNLKATDLQASIGLAQIGKIDNFVATRRKNWNLLRSGLGDLAEFFILPNPTNNSNPSWFGFILTLRPGVPFTRHEIINFLESKNIQTRLLFAGNLTRQPFFDEMRSDASRYRKVGNLAETDRVMNNSFWLGVYPGMRPGMIEYMIDIIREFLKK